jgi:hypothetical protein
MQTSMRATPCVAVRHAGAVRLPRRVASLIGRAPAVSQRRGRVAVVRAVQAERPTSDAAAGSTDGVLDVVVVGGGISGLCTAQALVTKHAGAARRVLLTESRDRVGGNITTVSVRRARASRTPACAQARLSCMPALPAPPGTRGRTLRG